MANEDVLELRVQDNAMEAALGLYDLVESLTRVKEAIGKGLNLTGVVNGLKKLKDAVNQGLDESAIGRFERLATALEKIKGVGGIKIAGLKGLASSLNVSSGISDVQAEVNSTVGSVVGSIDAGAEAIEKTTSEVSDDIKESTGEASGAIKDTAKDIDEVKKKSNETGIGKLFQELKEKVTSVRLPFGKLLGDFMRIVKFRVLRTVIKEITGAFKIGIENVYRYSRAIGSSFAPNMDSAASSLLQMKNAIGAAVAPMIQSLIPVMQQVVSWFIEAVNWVNQFVSLLRGQDTWTRALPVSTKAFDDQTKKAKKASGAIKELLADWDELNIIQSETGSGGGSIPEEVTDYTKMFEEVGTCNKDIQNVVSFLKDNMNDILGIVGAIGAGIALWRFSSALGGSIGKLLKIADLAVVIGITLKLTDLFGKKYLSSGEPGWLIANALTSAIGATAAGVVASSFVSGAAAVAVGGFTMLLSGVVDIVNAGSSGLLGRNGNLDPTQKKARAWALGVLGSVKAGIGAAVMAGASGLSVTGSLAAGGLVLAGGLVYLSIKALVDMHKQDIAWGNESLTKQQVRSFVSTMFTLNDVTATVNLIDATVNDVGDAKSKVEAKLNEMLVPLESLILGINTDDSLEKIKEAVFGKEGEDGGLIKELKTWAEQKTVELKTNFSLIPIYNGNGENVTEEFESAGVAGYSEMTTILDTLANDLSTHLGRSMDESLNEQLRAYEIHAVEEITKTLANVSRAVTEAETNAQALTNFVINVKDFDQMSTDEILKEYDKYRKEIEAGYYKIYQSSAQGYSSLSTFYNEMAKYALEEAGGDITNETYQDYLAKAKAYAAKYEFLIDTMNQQVATAVEKASAGEGAKELRKVLMEKMMLGGSAASGWESNATLNNAFSNLRYNFSYKTNEENVADLNKVLDELLKEEFSDADYKSAKAAIDAGIMRYTDFFTQEYFEKILVQNVQGGKAGGLYPKILQLFLDEQAKETALSVDVPVDITFNPQINPYVKTLSKDFMVEKFADYFKMDKSAIIELFPDENELRQAYAWYMQNFADFDTVQPTGKHVSQETPQGYFANGMMGKVYTMSGKQNLPAINTNSVYNDDRKEEVEQTEVAIGKVTETNKKSDEKLALIASIVSSIDGKANRPITINLTPSAAAGRFVGSSERIFARVNEY